MAKITSIKAHRILNSRGTWTVDTRIELDNGLFVEQTVPSGASTGENEAIYIPVENAEEILAGPISDALIGEDPTNQARIDQIMLDMDGSANKCHLGGNSILSVSLAVARLSATILNIELFEYISRLAGKEVKKVKGLRFPTPVFNILNGGKHAMNNLAVQEFMAIPAQGLDFVKQMEIGVSVYQELKNLLVSQGYEVGVGDEGGFAPEHLTTRKALSFIRDAVNKNYKLGENVFMGMDVAAGSFVEHHSIGTDEDSPTYKINEENLNLDIAGLIAYYEVLVKEFPLIYIEDPFYEKDFKGWKKFYELFSKKLMVVADDLVVTNKRFLDKAIEMQLNNAVIVKPNQVGSLTETLEFIKTAKENNMSLVISHRSGDTGEDTFIADLALGVEAEFMKSGAPVRGERVVKYNRLLDVYSEIN